jgi:hypothetical protein
MIVMMQDLKIDAMIVEPILGDNCSRAHDLMTKEVGVVVG